MNFDYDPEQRLKRTDAGFYLRQKYRIGSPSYLAKLAMIGGGPLYEKVRVHTTYRVKDLDDWVLGKTATPKKDAKTNMEEQK